jgi:hypothetical protein
MTMVTIKLCGRQFQGRSILVAVDGQPAELFLESIGENAVGVELVQRIADVNADCKVIIEGGVGGDVIAEGAVSCGGVSGDVRSALDVKCGGVSGDVAAGNDIQCGGVSGDVEAGGDVTCGSVSGDVSAGGDVHCDRIEGDVL